MAPSPHSPTFRNSSGGWGLKGAKHGLIMTYGVSPILFLMSLGSLSHFKKCLCCLVEFRDRVPLQRHDITQHQVIFLLGRETCIQSNVMFYFTLLTCSFLWPFQHYLEKYKYIGQEAADPNMKVAEISEGPKLHEAIRAFQRMAGLPQTGRAQRRPHVYRVCSDKQTNQA